MTMIPCLVFILIVEKILYKSTFIEDNEKME